MDWLEETLKPLRDKYDWAMENATDDEAAAYERGDIDLLQLQDKIELRQALAAVAQ
jgi:hypothetical protein